MNPDDYPEAVDAAARALFDLNTPTDPYFVIHGRVEEVADGNNPYLPIARAALGAALPLLAPSGPAPGLELAPATPSGVVLDRDRIIDLVIEHNLYGANVERASRTADAIIAASPLRTVTNAEDRWVPVAESGARWEPRTRHEAEKVMQDLPVGGTYSDGEPWDGITHIIHERRYVTEWQTVARLAGGEPA